WLPLLLLSACLPSWFVEVSVPEREVSVSPARGRRLLLNKSFLKVGVPIRLTEVLYPVKLEPSDSPVALGRDWMNDFLPTGYTGRMLGDVPSATENCLLCHAGAVNGTWLLGLGNSFVDAELP